MLFRSNLPIGLNGFTWSFWAKTSVSGTRQTIINRVASTTGWVGTFDLPFSSSANGLFSITSTAYLGGVNIHRYVSPASDSSNTTDGKWHYFVLTCDRSQAELPDIYLDGVLANGTGNGNCNVLVDDIPSGVLYIGSTGGTSRYFNGSIDDVRFFNAAMPTSQIKNDTMSD